MTLQARLNLLTSRIGNYIRDSILPRVLPSGGSDGQVLVKNGSTNYISSWQNYEQFYILATDFPTSVTTRATVNDFTFNVTSGKSYYIDFIGAYQSSITTTGISIGLVTTATASIKGNIDGDISATAVATGLKAPLYAINSVNTTTGSFMTTTGVSVINTNHGINIRAIISASTSGTVSIQVGSEVATTSVTLMSGSVLRVRQIN